MSRDDSALQFPASPHFSHRLVSTGEDNMLDAGSRIPLNESPTQAARQPLQLHSRDLFAQHRQVLIRHGADTYVLRLTRQGKLILTK